MRSTTELGAVTSSTRLRQAFVSGSPTMPGKEGPTPTGDAGGRCEECTVYAHSTICRATWRGCPFFFVAFAPPHSRCVQGENPILQPFHHGATGRSDPCFCHFGGPFEGAPQHSDANQRGGFLASLCRSLGALACVLVACTLTLSALPDPSRQILCKRGLALFSCA